MKENYKTLDDYLDALDAVKEKVAEETQGMTTKQVKAYFARAARNLQKATGEKSRVGRASRKSLQPQRGAR